MRQALTALLLCLLAAGCVTAPRPQPWLENGQQVGSIHQVKTPGGAQWRYVDHAGLLKRTELRGQGGELLPGPSVRAFAYDSGRRLVEERVLDGRGSPALCEAGYACKRVAFATDAQNNAVEERTFFDASGRAACMADKYARARLLCQGPAGFVKEVVLEDAQGQPAAAVWDGVAGVHRVSYTLLTGIGDVRCGVYYNAKGEVVARRQLEGACAYSRQNGSPAGPGPNFGGPPPIRIQPRR